MTDFERFAAALAQTESNSKPEAWGDQGLACGRWQMHPAWYHDWAAHNVPVDASWDKVFFLALQNFYNTHVPAARVPIKLAMEFHLGGAAVRRGDWDEAYAVRFVDWYAKLGEPETA